MQQPPFRDLTVAQFVAQLSSAEPVPGGGSAAAVAGALAAGLVAMVAVLSQDRPKYAEHADLHVSAGSEARQLSDRLLDFAQEDADAYAAYAAAMKLPKESEEQRTARSEAMRAAARVAADVPLRTLETCLEVVRLAEALAGRCNLNAACDLQVAALLAEAAARGAAGNVHVNLPSVGDPTYAEATAGRTNELVGEVARLASETRETVASGGQRPPLALLQRARQAGAPTPSS